MSYGDMQYCWLLPSILQYFDDLPGAVRTLADQGARGVQLFFVASAITLCMSWEARRDGAIPFYIRRLHDSDLLYRLSCD